MILVDTAVWIDHLHKAIPWLTALLGRSEALSHPFVVGELACGQIQKRTAFLANVSEMPKALVASDDEVLELIESHRLMGKGLSYIDVHLLASALISNAAFWTTDKRLAMIAFQLRLAPTLARR